MSQSFASQKNSPLKRSPISTKVKNRFGAKAKTNTLFYEIRSIGFPPFGVEAFEYSKVTNGQRSEAYSIPFRRLMDSEDETDCNAQIEEGGFFASLYQRMNITENSRSNGIDNWPRYWLLRSVPGNNPSTSQSRNEGAEILKAFFMDPRQTQYPPKQIDIVDITSTDPVSMQHFFLDGDVIRILEHVIDEEFFNVSFAHSFPELADIAFSGPIFPTESIIQLGFGSRIPRTDGNLAYAPNFDSGESSDRTTMSTFKRKRTTEKESSKK